MSSVAQLKKYEFLGVYGVLVGLFVLLESWPMHLWQDTLLRLGIAGLACAWYRWRFKHWSFWRPALPLWRQLVISLVVFALVFPKNAGMLENTYYTFYQPVKLILPAILIGIGPAVMEEVFCRGLLLAGFWWLLARTNPFNRYFGASSLSSAIFAVTHLNNLFYGNAVSTVLFQVAETFVMGLVLALITLATHALWGAIGFHFLFDLAPIGTFDMSTPLTVSEFGFEMLTLIPMLLVAVIGLWYLARRQK